MTNTRIFNATMILLFIVFAVGRFGEGQWLSGALNCVIAAVFLMRLFKKDEPTPPKV